jgi:hypothetical protein
MARIWEGISEEVIFDILIIVGASCWVYDGLIDIEGFDGFLVKRSDEHELFFEPPGQSLQKTSAIQTNADGNKYDRVWVGVGLDRDPSPSSWLVDQGSRRILRFSIRIDRKSHGLSTSSMVYEDVKSPEISVVPISTQHVNVNAYIRGWYHRKARNQIERL